VEETETCGSLVIEKKKKIVNLNLISTESDIQLAKYWYVWYQVLIQTIYVKRVNERAESVVQHVPSTNLINI